ncbi:MAG: nuclear transport factor 2 family protein [Alphaproteobacteria bacterium]|nr:nuclear transport factor 2 family protein [Alphaproteobacteria bacterium]MBU1513363.1 nuclear transport factor 2 family protein [Alphaproteobacteria bacterium]MBU2096355.1 nuclear transport factor 2 family protein [Alphaproteobacteria bacterium]MBU2149953.1 nuclear transport factor 2 family protein [Alphaproteobacteria bacterium]MBU2309849.1 nuclear transport factor 2 family protein [Alphaproteobacteria bacterium]
MTQATESDIRAQLAEIRDRQKISDLVLDYCRGVDRLDDALLRSTYWPDAIDNHGVRDENAMVFCDRVLPLLREHATSTMHLVANCRLELNGDHASGETYVVAYHVLKSARSLDTFVGPDAAQQIRAGFPDAEAEAPFEYHAGARYLDRFERRGGEWRIAYRGLVFEWTQAHPASVSLGLLARARGRRDASDASYAVLSGAPNASAL